MSFLKVDTSSVQSADDDFVFIQDEPDVPDIPTLSDSEYQLKAIESFQKCLNSKNVPKEVPIYYDYKTRVTITPRGENKFPSSYMLASFFMTSFNLGMSVAFKVVRAFNSFDIRALDRSIVYREGHVNLQNIPVNIRHIFENTEVINDKYMLVKACIIVEDELLKEMSKFLQVVNNLAPSEYSDTVLSVYKPLMAIKSSDFLSMSPTSRIKILSQTVNIKRNVLHVSLNIKKDIGNLGREYHLLTSIPRIDRDKIPNLWGYDFESALQTIVLAILTDIVPTETFSVTDTFVNNKRYVRQYVVDILGVNMEIAKKIITAAYQGGCLGGISKITGFRLNAVQRKGMSGLYDETKIIMDELVKISSKSYIAPKTVLGSHFKAACWYASKRTTTKWELTEDFTFEIYHDFLAKYGKAKAKKFPKSYMFYFWTYFEGEARKIVQSHLKQAITLHDAVYTQDEASFKSMIVTDVEAEIYKKLGIRLKLGKA
jgi:hypothetical protein